jgi:hypothetical protein
MTTPSKLYKLRKDATTIAGVAVKGNGSVSYKETAQAVSPQGGLRSGKTCIVSVGETLTFSLEDATTASVPQMGTHGSTDFTADEMTGGTGRGAGIKGTAAQSTVIDVGIGHNQAGQATVEVTVAVESADETAAGLAWSAGAAPT